MKFYRVVYVLIIAASITIFSYLMFYFPWRCNQIIVLSGGTVTCGLNVGAYVIAIASCVVAAAAALILIQEK